MTINDSAIRSSNMSPSGPFRRTALGRLAAARSGTSFRRPLLCCTYGADLLCCTMGAEQVCCTMGAEQVCCTTGAEQRARKSSSARPSDAAPEVTAVAFTSAWRYLSRAVTSASQLHQPASYISRAASSATGERSPRVSRT
jgi:hypothetical protein